MLRIFLPFIYALAYVCRAGGWLTRALEWAFTWIGLLGIRFALVLESGRLVSIYLLADAAAACTSRQERLMRDPRDPRGSRPQAPRGCAMTTRSDMHRGSRPASNVRDLLDKLRDMEGQRDLYRDALSEFEWRLTMLEAKVDTLEGDRCAKS